MKCRSKMLLIAVVCVCGSLFSHNLVLANSNVSTVEYSSYKTPDEEYLIQQLILEGKIDIQDAEKIKIVGIPQYEESKEVGNRDKTNYNELRDAKGIWIQSSDGRWWFKYNDGHYAVAWDKIDGKWYYFDKKGWMKEQEWIKPDGHWYYMTKTGAMATGLYNVRGTNYFFRDNGVCAENNGIAISLYGQTFVGDLAYVWRGTDLSTGVDCSGFVMALHKTFGITTPRVAEDQINGGIGVAQAEAKQGDVVCYSGHVAIYIGKEKVVHAPMQGQKVSIVRADQMGKDILAVRRYW